MARSSDIPMTLTEAQVKSGYSLVAFGVDSTQSTSRTIPYLELYHGRSGIMETLAEHLQKAAEDEKARKSKL